MKIEKIEVKEPKDCPFRELMAAQYEPSMNKQEIAQKFEELGYFSESELVIIVDSNGELQITTRESVCDIDYTHDHDSMSTDDFYKGSYPCLWYGYSTDVHSDDMEGDESWYFGPWVKVEQSGAILDKMELQIVKYSRGLEYRLVGLIGMVEIFMSNLTGGKEEDLLYMALPYEYLKLQPEIKGDTITERFNFALALCCDPENNKRAELERAIKESQ